MESGESIQMEFQLRQKVWKNIRRKDQIRRSKIDHSSISRPDTFIKSY